MGKSGKLWESVVDLWEYLENVKNFLYGDLNCKVDEKGRFLIPSSMLKLLPEAEREEFVLNKNTSGCLELYPQKYWLETLEVIFNKNQWVPENREFARRFQSGAANVTVDKAGRILIPKQLAAYAGIDKELMIKGVGGVFEIWNVDRYNEWETSREIPMEHLQQKVMGNPSPPDSTTLN
jgi:MraZ protein